MFSHRGPRRPRQTTINLGDCIEQIQLRLRYTDKFRPQEQECVQQLRQLALKASAGYEGVKTYGPMLSQVAEPEDLHYSHPITTGHREYIEQSLRLSSSDMDAIFQNVAKLEHDVNERMGHRVSGQLTQVFDAFSALSAFYQMGYSQLTTKPCSTAHFVIT